MPLYLGEKGLKQLVQPEGIANTQTMASNHHRKDVPDLASESHAKLELYSDWLTLLLTTSLSVNFNLLSSSLALTSKLNTSFLPSPMCPVVLSPFSSALRSRIILAM